MSIDHDSIVKAIKLAGLAAGSGGAGKTFLAALISRFRELSDHCNPEIRLAAETALARAYSEFSTRVFSEDNSDYL